MLSDSELVNLYKSGLSLGQISAQTGIPHETARVRLHRLGVQMRHVLPIYSSPLTSLDFDSAMLLGLHVGDGWISGRWGISIHSTDKGMTTEVIRLVRAVLGVEPGVTTHKIDHVTIIQSAKSQVIEFFKSYGMPEGRKSATIEVPKAIFTGGIEIKRGFLRGLFSADGCFYWKGFRGECRLEVASKILRDGFVLLASQLRFDFRKYSYIHKGGHNKVPLHLAYLGRQHQVIRWMNEIGSICDTHMTKFNNLMSSVRQREDRRKHFWHQF